MDSLTQFTLGAVLGEAVLGKKIGNRAILWGGIAGTIPDLDVLIPVSGAVGHLVVHRGYSHSLLFAFIAGPLLALLLYQWYKQGGWREQVKKELKYSFFEGLWWLLIGSWYTRLFPSYDVSRKHDFPSVRLFDWALLFFLGFFTHPLIDAFTVYGTQLYLPFSDYREGFNNMFIVDFFYTLPMCFAWIICLFLFRSSKARRWVNNTGIALSLAYVCFTFGSKLMFDQVFKAELERQNVEYSRFMSGPTPLNAILWYGIAEVENGYQIGYYSHFDKDKEINLVFVPRNDELIADIKDDYIVDRLIWFSKGYYTVRERADGSLRFHAIQFGQMDMGLTPEDDTDDYVFGFTIKKDKEGAVYLDRRDSERGPENRDITFSGLFNVLKERVMGNEQIVFN